MSDRAAAAAAIFDVDGTICDTRSTASLSLVWLRRRQHSPWRHRMWLSSLAWRIPWLWLSDRVSRDAADRQVYRQYAGLSRQQVVDDARRCCEEVLLPACFPEALAEMAKHRAEGRRLVLVSGGVDIVLAPLAEALGAELLSQRLVSAGDRLTGAYRGYAVLGEQQPVVDQAARKAAALARYAETTGIDLHASFGYGDSLNDLAMLEIVGTAIVVRPDRRLAQIAGVRGWDVRHWGD